MPTSRLIQLLKLIRVFGVAGGIRLWFAIVRQAHSAALIELQVPGLKAPIHLRTRDLPIFWQIMVMQENNLQSFPQAVRAEQTYRDMLAGSTPVIVDCGGHIGLSAVWFATRFPEALVYSVEPDKANFKLLQQNAGPYSNIVPVNGGIWNRPCHLIVSNPQSGSASFRLQEVSEVQVSADNDTLRSYTIDELAARDPGQQLFLVKIDVEGAESEIFDGPALWLDAATVVIIELHDWLLPGQGTSKNLFRQIASHNLDVLLQGENLVLFQVTEENRTEALVNN